MKGYIAIVERIFPLYRKAVLDLIYTEKKFIFFHTVNKKSGIRQTTAPYSSIVRAMYYGHKESGMILFLLAKMFRNRPAIIIHEFSAGIISIIPLIVFCKLARIKLIFWGHMYNRVNGFSPKQSVSDRYRRWLWKRADSLITYSQAEKRLLTDNNIPAEKVFVAYNTVDTNTFLKLRDKLEETGRSACKRQLNFRHEFNLTFIGRLYREKKPELLLDLLADLKQAGFTSTAIHFIGSGEMDTELRTKAAEMGLGGDVFFHGAIYDEVRTGEMLFCSDLMIMPGCVGLSVNHAFCFNCPVVTFKEIGLDPAHGPEIEYIIDGKTGFQLQDHTTKALTEVVTAYLLSPEMRMAMRAEIRNFIETECSVDRMAEGVIQAINYNTSKTI